jgi:protocadherin Fat 4
MKRLLTWSFAPFQGSPTSNTATATVDISVGDRNDHPPVFTAHFNTRVPENTPVGTFVLKITSTDRDVGDNALHVYTLTQNPDGKFAIDAHSGNMTVAGALDRERRDEYILQLAANDGSYNAETSVSIYILDVNDNAPQFEQQEYKFLLAELQPQDTNVGKVCCYRY